MTFIPLQAFQKGTHCFRLRSSIFLVARKEELDKTSAKCAKALNFRKYPDFIRFSSETSIIVIKLQYKER